MSPEAEQGLRHQLREHPRLLQEFGSKDIISIQKASQKQMIIILWSVRHHPHFHS